jgi:hypothetical protein
MSMYRAYTVDSGLIAVSATGLTPLLYVAPTSTNDAHLINVKVSAEAGGTAPTAVSNSDLFFSANVVTGTKAGGGAVTPAPLGSNSLAANTVFSSASSAAITGLTQSTEKWGQPIPFTGGAFSSEDWANTGEEIDLLQSTLNCFYVNVPVGPGYGGNWYVRVIAKFTE